MATPAAVNPSGESTRSAFVFGRIHGAVARFEQRRVRLCEDGCLRAEAGVRPPKPGHTSNPFPHFTEAIGFFTGRLHNTTSLLKYTKTGTVFVHIHEPLYCICGCYSWDSVL